MTAALTATVLRFTMLSVAELVSGVETRPIATSAHFIRVVLIHAQVVKVVVWAVIAVGALPRTALAPARLFALAASATAAAAPSPSPRATTSARLILFGASGLTADFDASFNIGSGTFGFGERHRTQLIFRGRPG
jgi:hypothetical protein